MGLSWLWLAIGASVQATEFQIDTDTPDALCPELSITREAVRRRLGEVEADGNGHWHGLYSTVHDPTGGRGDYVRLVIVDGSGTAQLTRELPIKGESCENLAQAIALVVDGFFHEQSAAREAAMDGSPAPLAPLASVPTDNTLRARPQTAAPAQPALSVPPKTKKSDTFAGLSLGGGYESVASNAAFSWGFFFAERRGWLAQLTLSTPAASVHEQHGAAEARAYVAPVRLALAHAFDLATNTQWFIGPDTILSLEHAAANGITQGRSGWRASFGLGGQMGLMYWVTPSVALVPNISAQAMLVQGRKFTMYDEPVLELPRGRFFAAIDLWMRIF